MRHSSFMCYLTHSGKDTTDPGVTVLLFIVPRVVALDETWLMHMCAMIHSNKWHRSLMLATWLIRVWAITHWCKRHDSLMWATWLIHASDVTHSCALHHSLVVIVRVIAPTETRLIHVCNMIYCFERHDSFMWVTWLVNACDTVHSSSSSASLPPVRHALLLGAIWFIHECDTAPRHHPPRRCAQWVMTDTCVWHDFTCVWHDFTCVWHDFTCV